MTTTLPELRRTRELHTFSFVDAQLSDPLNLGLDEFSGGALTAVFTALAMLLLADIVYRVIVRARERSVSSFSVQRSYLLARITNPIALFSWAARRAYRTRRGATSGEGSEAGRDDACKRRRGSAFPRGTRFFIFFFGLLVIVSDLFFIFLSTSSSVDVWIDASRLTSIALRDDGSNVVFDLDNLHDNNCVSKPLTEKAYFMSTAQRVHCITYSLGESEEEIPPDVARLLVGIDDDSFIVFVTTTKFAHWMRFSNFVMLANHTGYHVIPDVTKEDVRRKVPSVLRRYGFQVDKLGELAEEDEFFLDRKWEIGYEVNVSQLALPESFMTYSRNRSSKFEELLGPLPPASFAWNVYVGNVVASLIHMEGESEAFRFDYLPNITLSQYDGSYIEKQAPRMSLGGCIILCGTLLIVWVVVAWGFRWRSSIEHRYAWVRMFETMVEPEDLARSHEQHVNVLTKRTSTHFLVQTDCKPSGSITT